MFSGAETAEGEGEGGREETGMQVMRGREVEDIAQELLSGLLRTGEKWGCC
jgi:hypothetical protein